METIAETALTRQAPLPNQRVAAHEPFTPSRDDCRRDTVLLFLAHPAVKTEPLGGSFHCPTFRYHLKACRAFRTFDDFQVDAIALAQRSDPFGDSAGIDAVGPDLSVW